MRPIADKAFAEGRIDVVRDLISVYGFMSPHDRDGGHRLVVNVPPEDHLWLAQKVLYAQMTDPNAKDLMRVLLQEPWKHHIAGALALSIIEQPVIEPFETYPAHPKGRAAVVTVIRPAP